jgi:hypothetical protein
MSKGCGSWVRKFKWIELDYWQHIDTELLEVEAQRLKDFLPVIGLVGKVEERVHNGKNRYCLPESKEIEEGCGSK